MYVSDLIITGAAAYLLGSIPFGIVLAKLFRLPDPRTIGSGNIGATNMLRTGNKKVALATLLLDAGKGALAVCLATHISADTGLHALAVMGAALGHMYSPWLKFTGGKGVATVLGGVLALDAAMGGIFCLTFLLVFVPSRYVSLASVTALALLPIVGWALVGMAVVPWLAVASGVAIHKHSTNLARLREGTEPKLWTKRDAS